MKFNYYCPEGHLLLLQKQTHPCICNICNEGMYDIIFHCQSCNTYNICLQCMIKKIERSQEKNKFKINYKGQLLQYYQKQKWNPPKYEIINEKGPAHQKIFDVVVLDNVGKIIDGCVGQGYTRQEAEQESSMKALIYFGVIEPVLDVEDDDILI